MILDQALGALSLSTHERNHLTLLIQQLEACSCTGIDEKLKEYTGQEAKVHDLLAELRMARALSLFLGLPVGLQSGDEADLRLRNAAVDITIEVEHKSSTSPLSEIFHPYPENLRHYARGKPWQVASHQLHRLLEELPLEIQPWIDSELDEPHWDGKERSEQERKCESLAQFLITSLPDVPLDRETQLVHKLARFDIKPLIQPPGRITGAGPLNAFILNEYPNSTSTSLPLSCWLARAIRRKCKIANDYPHRRGAQHVIGLVIDEAFASNGHVLVNTFLGGLHSNLDATCGREVPETKLHLLEGARIRGRSDLLHLMQFELGGNGQGLILDDAIHQNAEGVLALYYTDKLQFIPNPFTAQPIDSLCRLFPRTIEPFHCICPTRGG